MYLSSNFLNANTKSRKPVAAIDFKYHLAFVENDKAFASIAYLIFWKPVIRCKYLVASK